MTRDELFREISRSLFETHPDRADEILRELEKIAPVFIPHGLTPVLSIPDDATEEDHRIARRLFEALEQDRPIVMPHGWSFAGSTIVPLARVL